MKSAEDGDYIVEFLIDFSKAFDTTDNEILVSKLHNYVKSAKVLKWLNAGLSGKRIPISNSLNAWWRHQMETFPRNWPFVRGIHRSPVNSPHKGQWRRALVFSINDWVNNREAGDLRRYRVHYDVIVMEESPMARTHTRPSFISDIHK